MKKIKEKKFFSNSSTFATKKVFFALRVCALFCICAIFFVTKTAAFEWPVKEFNVENFSPSFAQNKKQNYSASFFFRNAHEVCATESGKVRIVILERNEDGFNWFQSPLGNCVVLTHKDSLVSVYGNLEKTCAEACLEKETFYSGEILGVAANSAWSEEEKTLEFQIADCAKKTFLNPQIFMPQAQIGKRVFIEDLVIQNRLGHEYELSKVRTIPAGMYSIYKRKPFFALEITLFVNGVQTEKIIRNTLKTHEGRLVLQGQRPYSNAEFYPDHKKELLGHVLLPHGNNTITIVANDFSQKEISFNFNIKGY